MPTYYHVDRSNKVKANQKFDLQTDYEQLDIWNVTGVYSKDDAVKRTSSLYPNGISEHGIRYLLMTRITVFKPNTRTPEPYVEAVPLIEGIFEMVRRAEFPDRPSRMQSMFGWLEKKDAQNFLVTEGRGKIHEVSSHNAFIGDQKLLYLGASVIGGYELARRYWAGEKTENPLLEAVIPLPCIIGNVI